LGRQVAVKQLRRILELSLQQKKLEDMAVNEYVDRYVS
jgi:2-methylcitrate dehydratase